MILSAKLREIVSTIIEYVSNFIMNDLLITLATEPEKTWAAELMAQSEPWTTLGITLEKSLIACRDVSNHVYIAHDHDMLCGLIILQDKGVAGSPYIKSIAVAQVYQNQGIGKQLLKFAEDQYRGNSKHLFLCVSSFNKMAQHLYQEYGFRVVGEFNDYIVDGLSEILMHKRLR